MAEMSIDELIIKAATSSDVGNNLSKAESMFGSLDGALTKGEKVLGFLERIIEDADRSRTVAAALRITAAKLGVDLNAPLPSPGGELAPRSDAHATVMQALNGLTKEEIVEAADVLNRWFIVKKNTGADKIEGAGQPGAGAPPDR